MSVNFNRLAVSITAHAWNADRTLLALCPNDPTIQIYKYASGEFSLVETLTQHDAVVTSLAWGHKQNRILSCSQDRNAYVWRYEKDTWNPTLVLLRINRAATRCAWSPREDKFAVASGSKVVAVCYFDKEYDWWVSKHIKLHNSTVLDVAWHPNNVLIATASSDSHVRVISAFIKGCDTKEDVTNDAFGTKLPFETLCTDIKAGGWVHAVNWAPDGNKLGWVSHDCTVSVLECASAAHNQIVVKTPQLPFMDIIWVSPNSFVAGGHDCAPFLFNVAGGSIAAGVSLDQKTGAGAKAAGGPSNMSTWQNRDKLGAADGAKDQNLETQHQNCITSLQAFGGAAPKLTAISSTGLDGGVAIWNLDSLSKAIAGLKIN